MGYHDYKAFFRNKTKMVKAPSLYEAKEEACIAFGVKPRQRHEVHVYLAAKWDEATGTTKPVSIDTASL